MELQAVSLGILFLLATASKDCAGEMNASHLMHTLFNNYEKSVMPNCGDGSVVQLKVGIAVRQIIELNEPKQILQTNVWMRMQWNDCRLAWNQTETGISTLKIPHGLAWIPDITLYDSVENELGGLKDYLQDVRPDGTIYYNFPSVIKSLCKIDVTYFPFDKQTCRLKFGSWTLRGWELDVLLSSPKGDMTSYVPNVEWDIIDVPAARHEAYYGCCPEPFPDVTFYIQLDRKPQFYVLSLMFPCILISSIAILGFLLPPESGEKVSLEITVLLSVAVFMLMVSETMPPNSETFPYIGVYFACAMLLVSLSCLMTVTVLNLHFKGEHGVQMPAWVRIVFLDGIGRLIKVTQSRNKINDVSQDKHEPISVDTDQQQKPTKAQKHNQTLELTDYAPPNKFVDLLDKQLEALQNINDNVSGTGKDPPEDEWKIVARVVDRLCLLLFTLLQTIGILILICGTGFNTA